MIRKMHLVVALLLLLQLHPAVAIACTGASPACDLTGTWTEREGSNVGTSIDITQIGKDLSLAIHYPDSPLLTPAVMTGNFVVGAGESFAHTMFVPNTNNEVSTNCSVMYFDDAVLWRKNTAEDRKNTEKETRPYLKLPGNYDPQCGCSGKGDLDSWSTNAAPILEHGLLNHPCSTDTDCLQKAKAYCDTNPNCAGVRTDSDYAGNHYSIAIDAGNYSFPLRAETDDSCSTFYGQTWTWYMKVGDPV
jgi:hypothetical protein